VCDALQKGHLYVLDEKASASVRRRCGGFHLNDMCMMPYNTYIRDIYLCWMTREPLLCLRMKIRGRISLQRRLYDALYTRHPYALDDKRTGSI